VGSCVFGMTVALRASAGNGDRSGGQRSDRGGQRIDPGAQR
jgi:hypothetical protein